MCPKHADLYERWLFARPVIRPALVQIGGQSEAALVRHAVEAKRRRAEDHAALVRRQRAGIKADCAAGRGCTPSDGRGTHALPGLEVTS